MNARETVGATSEQDRRTPRLSYDRSQMPYCHPWARVFAEQTCETARAMNDEQELESPYVALVRSCIRPPRRAGGHPRHACSLSDSEKQCGINDCEVLGS